MANYEAMVERSGHGGLPEGCLCRIVGGAEGGAQVIEVWRAPDAARGFSEQNAQLLVEFKMPPPSHVAAFPITIYEAAGI